MTKDQVIIGRTYKVKVSGKIQPVMLTSVSRFGGWYGINTNTKRDIHIKTAAKLRGEFRCGQCANCQTAIAEKPSYSARLHACNMETADGMDQRLAIRREWAARLTSLNCTGAN